VSDNGREPLSYSDAHTELDALKAEIRAIERKHRQAGEDAAASEAWYRQELAHKFSYFRDQLGKAQDESMTLARGECAPDAWERDRARARVAHLAEVLEDRRGERASLHELVRWSQRKEPA
jgi:hypothetical protein